MAPLAPPPDGSFHTLRVVDEVTVRTARGGGLAWGQAEGRIAAPPAAVLAHLLDFEQLPAEVPRLDRLRVLQRSKEAPVTSEGEALVYFHFDLPWPVSNREYTARYRWRPLDGGAFEVVVTEANDAGPPATAVRVTGLHGRFELRPDDADGAATRIRYSFTADFGGLLPRAVKEETVWRQPLETIKGIRAAMARGSVRRGQ